MSACCRGSCGYDGRVPPTNERLKALRHHDVGRYVTLALSIAAMLAVVACGTLLPEPPPVPTQVDRFDLVANVPIAGAQLEIDLAVGNSLVSLVVLQSDVIVRYVVRGQRVHVVWIGGTPIAGPQVQLALERTVDSSDPPSIASAATYAQAGGDDLGSSHLAWRTAGSPPSLPDPFADGFGERSAVVPLVASFAERPLGDMDANGVVDVRDAMLLLTRLRNEGWSEFQRYHGDLDGDDTLDAADLDALLDKIVDPDLPATLHVKPRTAFGFAELSGATSAPALVLIANQGRQAATASELGCQLPPGVVASTRGGVAGQTVALELSLPSINRVGWQPGVATCGAGAGSIRLGNFVALVAGQSNASGFGQAVGGWPEAPTSAVRMFGNDYRWTNASEPLDSAAGQLDEVSVDSNAAYSFGTLLGNLLHDATGYTTYMIPAARGASRVTQPPSDQLDRWWQPVNLVADRNDNLFSSAVFRSRVSAGLASNPVQSQAVPSEAGPVNVLLWYQGESDAFTPAARNAFVTGTYIVMNAFDARIAAPVVFVQLGTHHDMRRNRQQHAIAELQRRMETGSGTGVARDDFHMVVAFDLPRSDHIHLSAFGQRLLAERLELAIREHVFGEDVDGTGPRLQGITWSGSTLTLRTTRPLSSDALNRDLFTVFEGPPNGSLDSGSDTVPDDYGTNTVGVSAVVRDPADPNNVRITLVRTPTSTPHVRYMGPPNEGPPTGTPSNPELWDVIPRDVVRAAEGIGASDLGLPLPSFGPLTPF